MAWVRVHVPDPQPGGLAPPHARRNQEDQQRPEPSVDHGVQREEMGVLQERPLLLLHCGQLRSDAGVARKQRVVLVVVDRELQHLAEQRVQVADGLRL